jgi:hypothetical protein
MTAITAPAVGNQTLLNQQIIDAITELQNGGGVSVSGDIPVITGMTVEHLGLGPQRHTRITFDDVAIALVDEAGVVAYKGTKIFDFPAGYIKFDGAVADLALTKSSAGVNADWDGDFSLGTVTASNNATLSSTEQNLLPSTPTPQAVSGATTAKGVSTATETVLFDGHTTPIDMYLNFLVDDADHNVAGTPCNLIVNGTINFLWKNLGDN